MPVLVALVWMHAAALQRTAALRAGVCPFITMLGQNAAGWNGLELSSLDAERERVASSGPQDSLLLSVCLLAVGEHLYCVAALCALSIHLA